jgi:hypothetical protein
MSTAVNLTIMPVQAEGLTPRIAIGFHSEHFSQCVYIPYTTYLDMTNMADQISEGITKSAAKIMGNSALTKE